MKNMLLRVGLPDLGTVIGLVSADEVVKLNRINEIGDCHIWIAVSDARHEALIRALAAHGWAIEMPK